VLEAKGVENGGRLERCEGGRDGWCRQEVAGKSGLAFLEMSTKQKKTSKTNKIKTKQ
jgi:hypothetical protein